MNYGGDAADQIVRYSMEGMEHTLRISGFPGLSQKIWQFSS